MKRIRDYFLILVVVMLPSWVIAQIAVSTQIKGIEGDIKDNVQASINQSLIDFNPRYVTDLAELRYLTKRAAQEGMKPFGYFHPIVRSWVFQDNEHWKVLINIQKGHPLIVKRLRIHISGQGKHDMLLRDFVKHFPLKKGSVFDSQVYESGKAALLNFAVKMGYLTASLQGSKVIISDTGAQVEIPFLTARQYHFGKTTFSKVGLSEAFLARFLSYHEGQPFAEESLIKLQSDLNKTPYFKKISLQTGDQRGKASIIPVHVKLTEQLPLLYQVGAGFDTELGAQLQTRVDFRRLSKNGTYGYSEISLSQASQRLVGSFIIPQSNPINDQNIIKAQLDQESDLQKGDSKRLDVSLLKKMDIHQITTTFGVNALIEKSSPTDNTPFNSHLVYPNFLLSRMWRFDAHRGLDKITWQASGMVSSKQLFSSLSFGRFIQKINIDWRITNRGHVIFRNELGRTLTKDLAQVPLSLQFATGGPSSVRGYAYQTIGPPNHVGRVYKVISLEWLERIYGHWYGSVFMDAGAVGQALSQPWLISTGVGVNYRTELGRLQVSVAQPQATKKFKLQFALGL